MSVVLKSKLYIMILFSYEPSSHVNNYAYSGQIIIRQCRGIMKYNVMYLIMFNPFVHIKHKCWLYYEGVSGEMSAILLWYYCYSSEGGGI